MEPDGGWVKLKDTDELEEVKNGRWNVQLHKQ